MPIVAQMSCGYCGQEIPVAGQSLEMAMMYHMIHYIEKHWDLVQQIRNAAISENRAEEIGKLVKHISEE